MPIVDVMDLANSKVGEVELADRVFGAEINEDLIYEAVRNFRAGLRAGTHATKVRGSVRGSHRGDDVVRTDDVVGERRA